MKRLSTALVLLAAALPAVALSFPTPTATLTRFQVEAISLRDVTFLFELTVENPYPLDLSFDGMDLTFRVEGTPVFKAESRGGFSVPARGGKANTFTVKLAYEDIIRVVKDYLSKDLLSTVIDGSLVIPLPRIPGLPRDYSFSYSLKQKIPAIKPKVSVLNFAVKPPSQAQVREALVKEGSKVDAGKALGELRDVLRGRKTERPVIDPTEMDVPVSVSFTIQLINEARAELSFPKLGYELFVNGDRLVVGESTGISRQAGRSLITVVNTFSSRSLSKNVKQLFADRSGAFSLRGTAMVKLPDEVSKEPLPLSFQEAGTFSLK